MKKHLQAFCLLLFLFVFVNDYTFAQEHVGQAHSIDSDFDYRIEHQFIGKKEGIGDCYEVDIKTPNTKNHKKIAYSVKNGMMNVKNHYLSDDILFRHTKYQGITIASKSAENIFSVSIPVKGPLFISSLNFSKGASFALETDQHINITADLNADKALFKAREIHNYKKLSIQNLTLLKSVLNPQDRSIFYNDHGGAMEIDHLTLEMDLYNHSIIRSQNILCIDAKNAIFKNTDSRQTQKAIVEAKQIHLNGFKEIINDSSATIHSTVDAVSISSLSFENKGTIESKTVLLFGEKDKNQGHYLFKSSGSIIAPSLEIDAEDILFEEKSIVLIQDLEINTVCLKNKTNLDLNNGKIITEHLNNLGIIKGNETLKFITSRLINHENASLEASILHFDGHAHQIHDLADTSFRNKGFICSRELIEFLNINSVENNGTLISYNNSNFHKLKTFENHNHLILLGRTKFDANDFENDDFIYFGDAFHLEILNLVRNTGMIEASQDNSSARLQDIFKSCGKTLADNSNAGNKNNSPLTGTIIGHAIEFYGTTSVPKLIIKEQAPETNSSVLFARKMRTDELEIATDNFRIDQQADCETKKITLNKSPQKWVLDGVLKTDSLQLPDQSDTQFDLSEKAELSLDQDFVIHTNEDVTLKGKLSAPSIHITTKANLTKFGILKANVNLTLEGKSIHDSGLSVAETGSLTYKAQEDLLIPTQDNIKTSALWLQMGKKFALTTPLHMKTITLHADADLDIDATINAEFVDLKSKGKDIKLNQTITVSSLVIDSPSATLTTKAEANINVTKNANILLDELIHLSNLNVSETLSLDAFLIDSQGKVEAKNIFLNNNSIQNAVFHQKGVLTALETASIGHFNLFSNYKDAKFYANTITSIDSSQLIQFVNAGELKGNSLEIQSKNFVHSGESLEFQRISIEKAENISLDSDLKATEAILLAGDHLNIEKELNARKLSINAQRMLQTGEVSKLNAQKKITLTGNFIDFKGPVLAPEIEAKIVELTNHKNIKASEKLSLWIGHRLYNKGKSSSLSSDKDLNLEAQSIINENRIEAKEIVLIPFEGKAETIVQNTGQIIGMKTISLGQFHQVQNLEKGLMSAPIMGMLQNSRITHFANLGNLSGRDLNLKLGTFVHEGIVNDFENIHVDSSERVHLKSNLYALNTISFESDKLFAFGKIDSNVLDFKAFSLLCLASLSSFHATSTLSLSSPKIVQKGNITAKDITIIADDFYNFGISSASGIMDVRVKQNVNNINQKLIETSNSNSAHSNKSSLPKCTLPQWVNEDDAGNNLEQIAKESVENQKAILEGKGELKIDAPFILNAGAFSTAGFLTINSSLQLWNDGDVSAQTMFLTLSEIYHLKGNIRAIGDIGLQFTKAIFEGETSAENLELNKIFVSGKPYFENNNQLNINNNLTIGYLNEFKNQKDGVVNLSTLSESKEKKDSKLDQFINLGKITGNILDLKINHFEVTHQDLEEKKKDLAEGVSSEKSLSQENNTRDYLLSFREINLEDASLIELNADVTTSKKLTLKGDQIQISKAIDTLDLTTEVKTLLKTEATSSIDAQGKITFLGHNVSLAGKIKANTIEAINDIDTFINYNHITALDNITITTSKYVKNLSPIAFLESGKDIVITSPLIENDHLIQTIGKLDLNTTNLINKGEIKSDRDLTLKGSQLNEKLVDGSVIPTLINENLIYARNMLSIIDLNTSNKKRIASGGLLSIKIFSLENWAEIEGDILELAIEKIEHHSGQIKAQNNLYLDFMKASLNGNVLAQNIFINTKASHGNDESTLDNHGLIHAFEKLEFGSLTRFVNAERGHIKSPVTNFVEKTTIKEFTNKGKMEGQSVFLNTHKMLHYGTTEGLTTINIHVDKDLTLYNEFQAKDSISITSNTLTIAGKVETASLSLCGTTKLDIQEKGILNATDSIILSGYNFEQSGIVDSKKIEIQTATFDNNAIVAASENLIISVDQTVTNKGKDSKLLSGNVFTLKATKLDNESAIISKNSLNLNVAEAVTNKGSIFANTVDINVLMLDHQKGIIAAHGDIHLQFKTAIIKAPTSATILYVNESNTLEETSFTNESHIVIKDKIVFGKLNAFFNKEKSTIDTKQIELAQDKRIDSFINNGLLKGEILTLKADRIKHQGAVENYKKINFIASGKVTLKKDLHSTESIVINAHDCTLDGAIITKDLDITCATLFKVTNLGSLDASNKIDLFAAKIENSGSMSGNDVEIKGDDLTNKSLIESKANCALVLKTRLDNESNKSVIKAIETLTINTSEMSNKNRIEATQKLEIQNVTQMDNFGVLKGNYITINAATLNHHAQKIEAKEALDLQFVHATSNALLKAKDIYLNKNQNQSGSFNNRNLLNATKNLHLGQLASFKNEKKGGVLAPNLKSIASIESFENEGLLSGAEIELSAVTFLHKGKAEGYQSLNLTGINSEFHSDFQVANNATIKGHKLGFHALLEAGSLSLFPNLELTCGKHAKIEVKEDTMIEGSEWIHHGIFLGKNLFLTLVNATNEGQIVLDDECKGNMGHFVNHGKVHCAKYQLKTSTLAQNGVTEAYEEGYFAGDNCSLYGVLAGKNLNVNFKNIELNFGKIRGTGDVTFVATETLRDTKPQGEKRDENDKTWIHADGNLNLTFPQTDIHFWGGLSGNYITTKGGKECTFYHHVVSESGQIVFEALSHLTLEEKSIVKAKKIALKDAFGTFKGSVESEDADLEGKSLSFEPSSDLKIVKELSLRTPNLSQKGKMIVATCHLLNENQIIKGKINAAILKIRGKAASLDGIILCEANQNEELKQFPMDAEYDLESFTLLPHSKLARGKHVFRDNLQMLTLGGEIDATELIFPHTAKIVFQEDSKLILKNDFKYHQIDELRVPTDITSSGKIEVTSDQKLIKTGIWSSEGDLTLQGNVVYDTGATYAPTAIVTYISPMAFPIIPQGDKLVTLKLVVISYGNEGQDLTIDQAPQTDHLELQTNGKVVVNAALNQQNLTLITQKGSIEVNQAITSKKSIELKAPLGGITVGSSLITDGPLSCHCQGDLIQNGLIEAKQGITLQTSTGELSLLGEMSSEGDVILKAQNHIAINSKIKSAANINATGASLTSAASSIVEANHNIHFRVTKNLLTNGHLSAKDLVLTTSEGSYENYGSASSENIRIEVSQGSLRNEGALSGNNLELSCGLDLMQVKGLLYADETLSLNGNDFRNNQSYVIAGSDLNLTFRGQVYNYVGLMTSLGRAHLECSGNFTNYTAANDELSWIDHPASKPFYEDAQKSNALQQARVIFNGETDLLCANFINENASFQVKGPFKGEIGGDFRNASNALFAPTGPINLMVNGNIINNDRFFVGDAEAPFTEDDYVFKAHYIENNGKFTSQKGLTLETSSSVRNTNRLFVNGNFNANTPILDNSISGTPRYPRIDVTGNLTAKNVNNRGQVVEKSIKKETATGQSWECIRKKSKKRTYGWVNYTYDTIRECINFSENYPLISSNLININEINNTNGVVNTKEWRGIDKSETINLILNPVKLGSFFWRKRLYPTQSVTTSRINTGIYNVESNSDFVYHPHLNAGKLNVKAKSFTYDTKDWGEMPARQVPDAITKLILYAGCISEFDLSIFSSHILSSGLGDASKIKLTSDDWAKIYNVEKPKRKDFYVIAAQAQPIYLSLPSNKSGDASSHAELVENDSYGQYHAFRITNLDNQHGNFAIKTTPENLMIMRELLNPKTDSNPQMDSFWNQPWAECSLQDGRMLYGVILGDRPELSQFMEKMFHYAQRNVQRTDFTDEDVLIGYQTPQKYKHARLASSEDESTPPDIVLYESSKETQDVTFVIEDLKRLLKQMAEQCNDESKYDDESASEEDSPLRIIQADLMVPNQHYSAQPSLMHDEFRHKMRALEDLCKLAESPQKDNPHFVDYIMDPESLQQQILALPSTNPENHPDLVKFQEQKILRVSKPSQLTMESDLSLDVELVLKLFNILNHSDSTPLLGDAYVIRRFLEDCSMSLLGRPYFYEQDRYKSPQDQVHDLLIQLVIFWRQHGQNLNPGDPFPEALRGKLNLPILWFVKEVHQIQGHTLEILVPQIIFPQKILDEIALELRSPKRFDALTIDVENDAFLSGSIEVKGQTNIACRNLITEMHRTYSSRALENTSKKHGKTKVESVTYVTEVHYATDEIMKLGDLSVKSINMKNDARLDVRSCTINAQNVLNQGAITFDDFFFANVSGDFRNEIIVETHYQEVHGALGKRSFTGHAAINKIREASGQILAIGDGQGKLVINAGGAINHKGSIDVKHVELSAKGEIGILYLPDESVAYLDGPNCEKGKRGGDCFSIYNKYSPSLLRAREGSVLLATQKDLRVYASILEAADELVAEARHIYLETKGEDYVANIQKTKTHKKQITKRISGFVVQPVIVSTGHGIRFVAYEDIELKGGMMIAGVEIELIGKHVRLTPIQLVGEESVIQKQRRGWSYTKDNLTYSTHKIVSTQMMAPHIEMSAEKDLLIQGSMLAALDTLALKAGGNIQVIEELVHHYVQSKHFGVHLEFFGSKAIRACLDHDMKRAERAFMDEFATLSHLMNLIESRHGVDYAAEGVKLIVDLYTLYKGIEKRGFKNYCIEQAASKVLRVGLTVEDSQSKKEWSEAILSVMKAREIVMKAGQNILLRGAQMEAETLSLEAQDRIDLQAAQEYARQVTRNRSIGIHANVNYDAENRKFLAPTIGVSSSYSKSSGSQATNINAHFDVQNFTASSDVLSLDGAVVNAENAHLKARILHMRSLTDRSSGRNRNISGGMDIDLSAPTFIEGMSVSGHYARGSYETANVGEQTGIRALGEFIAEIGETTHLQGAFIDAVNGVLKTPSLAHEDVAEYNRGKQISFGICNLGFSANSGFVMPEGSYKRHHQKGLVHSIASSGTQIVTQSNLNHLKRDLSHAREMVKNQKHYVRIVVPIPGEWVDGFFRNIGEFFGAMVGRESLSPQMRAYKDVFDEIQSHEELSEHEKAEAFQASCELINAIKGLKSELDQKSDDILDELEWVEERERQEIKEEAERDFQEIVEYLNVKKDEQAIEIGQGSKEFSGHSEVTEFEVHITRKLGVLHEIGEKIRFVQNAYTEFKESQPSWLRRTIDTSLAVSGFMAGGPLKHIGKKLTSVALVSGLDCAEENVLEGIRHADSYELNKLEIKLGITRKDAVTYAELFLGAAIYKTGQKISSSDALRRMDSKGGLHNIEGTLPERRSKAGFDKSKTGFLNERSVEFSKYWKKSVQFRGNKVYQRDDLIDPKKLDPKGRTNLERMMRGEAPYGADGKRINLHHMIQTKDGAIAEVTGTMHQDYSKILHINPKDIPSGINRSAFKSWREKYWVSRAKDFK